MTNDFLYGGKQVRRRSARATSRAGVRACAGFFENLDCFFQEIDQQNDFGKDAYVDLPQDDETEGHCVALQIKAGPTYRRRSGGYFVPINQHAKTWRESTVPVFGVVFDPELARLGWVDLTGYLRENPHVTSGRITVPPDNVLTAASFATFCHSVGTYSQSSADSLFLNLLSESPARQAQALNDAWALSRRDARYLLLCRRVILELPRSATRWLLWRLSHVAGNPDILYTSETWLPSPIQARLRASFSWSVSELVHGFQVIDPHEEWGRGTLGQCLDVLLAEDAGFLAQLPAVTDALLKSGDIETAERVTVVALGHTDDPLRLLQAQRESFVALQDSAWLKELILVLREDNYFSLYL
ncbi:MAG TPA: DUF4365 domain-containing protein [Rhodanobacter sp.]|nr:DUF4365 domain-containing protein [Rhodanobacter sp.]